MSTLDELSKTARSLLTDLSGFASALTITTPDGVSAVLSGFNADIGLTIDPETGTSVIGRKSTIALHLDDLADAGLSIPEGIHDQDQKPWVVLYTPRHGTPMTTRVVMAIPDRTMGIVVLHLESYRKL